MKWLCLYHDILSNLFIFLVLDLFLNSFSLCKSKPKQVPIKIGYLLVLGIFSLIPTIPYYTILLMLTELIYSLIVLKGNLFSRLVTYIKFQILFLIGCICIASLHTFLFLDSKIYTSNIAYSQLSNIIDYALLYIILSMYVILKKLSNFPSGKIYKRYFLGTTGLSVVLLVLCSMLLGSTILDQKNVVPLLFSVLLIVTMLCISIYKKVISILEENTLAKIEIEKNALEQAYYAQVQEGLKNLSLLRHDFKNHLAVLQGYATSGRTDELQSYISKLSDELTPATLITTPSLLLSAIINTKNEECKKKGITLSFEQQVTGIYLDDFHMVTIFSNMLDNAITAASKCEAGAIRLRLTSIDSYLDIDCVNNHKEQIIEKDGRFQTTKPTRRELHGLGIQSMRRAVRALNGELNIDYTNDSFHVNILVPNYL